MSFFTDRFKNTQNTDTVIGLDLGDSTIKWVSLARNRELEQYAIQAISMPMGTACIKDAKQIATRLKETLLDQRRIRQCVVNIPDILVCSKWVQIERADCQRIEEIIELVAAQSIPFPLNKFYFDYQVFETPSGSQEKCKVLLVASHKKDIDFRLDIIQQANLIPIAVEVSSHALERAYSFFYPDHRNKNTLLLDVGASQLSLLFLNNSQTIVYCEKLVNSLEKESVLLQIKRSIKRYILAHPDYSLSQIFLMGANQSLLSYLIERLEKFLKVKIAILKYQNRIKYSSNLNGHRVEKNSLNLFLSYGLALRASSVFKEK